MGRPERSSSRKRRAPAGPGPVPRGPAHLFSSPTGRTSKLLEACPHILRVADVPPIMLSPRLPGAAL
jgi:hypothetical protein